MLYSEKEVSTTRITKGLAYPPKGTSLKGGGRITRNDWTHFLLLSTTSTTLSIFFYLSINYNMVADKKTSTTTGRHLPLFATFQRLHAIILHLWGITIISMCPLLLSGMVYLFLCCLNLCFVRRKQKFRQHKTKVSSARNFYSSLSLSPSKSKIMHKVVDRRW